MLRKVLLIIPLLIVAFCKESLDFASWSSRVISALDKDFDGFISENEWQQAFNNETMSSYIPTVSKNATRLFTAVDLNADGLLNRTEIQSILERSISTHYSDTSIPTEMKEELENALEVWIESACSGSFGGNIQTNSGIWDQLKNCSGRSLKNMANFIKLNEDSQGQKNGVQLVKRGMIIPMTLFGVTTALMVVLLVGLFFPLTNVISLILLPFTSFVWALSLLLLTIWK